MKVIGDAPVCEAGATVAIVMSLLSADQIVEVVADGSLAWKVWGESPEPENDSVIGLTVRVP